MERVDTVAEQIMFVCALLESYLRCVSVALLKGSDQQESQLGYGAVTTVGCAGSLLCCVLGGGGCGCGCGLCVWLCVWLCVCVGCVCWLRLKVGHCRPASCFACPLCASVCVTGWTSAGLLSCPLQVWAHQQNAGPDWVLRSAGAGVRISQRDHGMCSLVAVGQTPVHCRPQLGDVAPSLRLCLCVCAGDVSCSGKGTGGRRVGVLLG
jgi:hypothetical protein